MCLRAFYRSRLCSSLFISLAILGVYWVLYVRTGVDDGWAAWSDFSQTVRDGHLMDAFEDQGELDELEFGNDFDLMEEEDNERFLDGDYEDVPRMEEGVYDETVLQAESMQHVGDVVDVPPQDVFLPGRESMMSQQAADALLPPRESGAFVPPQVSDADVPMIKPPPPEPVAMQLEVKGVALGKELLQKPDHLEMVIQQIQPAEGLRPPAQGYGEIIGNLPALGGDGLLVPTEHPPAQVQQVGVYQQQVGVNQPQQPQQPQQQISPLDLARLQVAQLQAAQDEANKSQKQQYALPNLPPDLPVAVAPAAPLLGDEGSDTQALPAQSSIELLQQGLDSKSSPDSEFGVVEPPQPDIIFRNKAEINDAMVASRHPVGAVPLMPRIVHQFGDDTDIPMKFAPWVQSWIRKNPGWQYWFWSPSDVERLIERKYPEYNEIYKKLSDSPVNRDNAMRFFVIHAFGGIFADMDVECLQSLEEWVYNHECFVVEETREEAYLINQRFPANVHNGVMGCRPHHPFFAAVLHALPEFFLRYQSNPVHATGSYFLDDMFRIYKSNASHSLLNSSNVELVEPDVFLPTYDPEDWDTIDEACHTNIVDMPFHVSWICTMWIKVREHMNEPYENSLTRYHWVKPHAVTGVVPKVSIIYLLLGETESS